MRDLEKAEKTEDSASGSHHYETAVNENTPEKYLKLSIHPPLNG